MDKVMYKQIVNAGLKHSFNISIDHFPNDDIEFCIANKKLPSDCVQFLGIKYSLKDKRLSGQTESKWGSVPA